MTFEVVTGGYCSVLHYILYLFPEEVLQYRLLSCSLTAGIFKKLNLISIYYSIMLFKVGVSCLLCWINVILTKIVSYKVINVMCAKFINFVIDQNRCVKINQQAPQERLQSERMPFNLNSIYNKL